MPTYVIDDIADPLRSVAYDGSTLRGAVQAIAALNETGDFRVIDLSSYETNDDGDCVWSGTPQEARDWIEKRHPFLIFECEESGVQPPREN